jgi:hypothetical protein
MAIYVLRDQTLTGGGSLAGRTINTVYQDTYLIPPEDPTESGTTTGAAGVSGCGNIAFESWCVRTDVHPFPYFGPVDYTVGFTVTVTDPLLGTTTNSAGTVYSVANKSILDIVGTGSWSISIDCELCLEVIDPTTPVGSGSGAVNYKPDPPVGRTYRLFYRKKAGGNYSVSASLGPASATRTGTFAVAAELPYPDSLSQTAYASVGQTVGGTARSITSQVSGTWRGAEIGTSLSSSGTHGYAQMSNSVGVVAVATCGNDPIADTGNARATRSVAVPLTYNLGAIFKAMETDYPDTFLLEYERAGTTVFTNVTNAFGETRTYRSESGQTEVQGGAEDLDTYNYPSDFGAIALRVDSGSAFANKEPDTDLSVFLKDRLMSAIAIETPGSTNDLTGTDSALGGSPWGVRRSYTTLTPPWRGLMGWRYLEIIIAETGGASAGAAVTIKIGTKEWTQDKTGSNLTAPGSGNSATFTIDLCSPSNTTTSVDSIDTTYPYSNDWQADGGDEDTYWRVGEGDYSGVMQATEIRIEVGTNRTFTITSIKGVRTIANTVNATNLPAHNAWVDQRPPTVVAETLDEPTTTYHYVRQSYEVDLEGRLLAAEWSDTEWQKTVGGVSGVTTHTLYIRTIEWLANRINLQRLCPGWTAAIAAPVPGTGPQAWYHRQREMHSLLGGGYYWVPPVGATAGYWSRGIDADQRKNTEGAIVLPWQGNFVRLNACPGNVGDVFKHNTGEDTGSLYLKAAKVFRTQGVGMALIEASGLPDAAATLTLRQNSTVRGTGTTDAYGYAQTGASYAKGDDGSLTLEFDPAHTASYDAKARKRRHFRSRIVEVEEGDWICHYRHSHDRACLYTFISGTGLVVWDFMYEPTDPNSTKTQTIIDSSSNCKMPTAWFRKENFHELVYLRGTQPYYGRSHRYVREWTLETIPGTAESITACEQAGRLIVALYHNNQWFVLVGLFNSTTGSYTFSSEQPLLPVNSAKPKGHLSTRRDNVIEFAYLNSSGAPRLVRCANLSKNAVGTWT